MLDAKTLLDQFFGQTGDTGVTGRPGESGIGRLTGLGSGPGAMAGSALAGGLVGLLLGGKKSRKLAASALKIGGIAVVGGLAYKAYSDWRAGKSPIQSAGTPHPQLPTGTAYLPATDREQQDLSRSLIRAMIAAAKADGHITADERQRISQQLVAMGVGPEGRSFIAAELAAPLDVGAIANCASSPELAAEIYAASLLAIDRGGAAERGYLTMLAARLGLEPGLVEHLHANADAIMALQPA